MIYLKDTSTTQIWVEVDKVFVSLSGILTLFSLSVEFEMLVVYPNGKVSSRQLKVFLLSLVF